MQYINIRREEDAKQISKYKKGFELKTLEELVKDYNKQARLGIVGVHQQALYLQAMRMEFEERLKCSPIHLQDYVLGMSGEVSIVKGNVVRSPCKKDM